jgi:hypothetical protein
MSPFLGLLRLKRPLSARPCGAAIRRCLPSLFTSRPSATPHPSSPSSSNHDMISRNVMKCQRFYGQAPSSPRLPPAQDGSNVAKCGSIDARLPSGSCLPGAHKSFNVGECGFFTTMVPRSACFAPQCQPEIALKTSQQAPKTPHACSRVGSICLTTAQPRYSLRIASDIRIRLIRTAG